MRRLAFLFCGAMMEAHRSQFHIANYWETVRAAILSESLARYDERRQSWR
jgi:hypothetical protein